MKFLIKIAPVFSSNISGRRNALRKTFLCIFFGNVIFVAATNLLTPLFALFVAQVSPLNCASTAGMLWGAFIAATVTFLALFNASKWFRKWHDADLLIAGMLLKIAGWALYIVKPGLGTMFCAQMLLGAGEAAGTPAFNAIMTNTSIKKNVAPRKLFSMWQVAASVSMALAAVSGGYVVKVGGFRDLFLCMIGLAGIAVLATMIFRRELVSLKEHQDNRVCVGTQA